MIPSSTMAWLLFGCLTLVWVFLASGQLFHLHVMTSFQLDYFRPSTWEFDTSEPTHKDWHHLLSSSELLHLVPKCVKSESSTRVHTHRHPKARNYILLLSYSCHSAGHIVGVQQIFSDEWIKYSYITTWGFPEWLSGRIHWPMQKMWVQSLGQEDLLEKGMATHSSILAWRIPWTEETGGLQSMGLQRVRHNWETKQQQQHHTLDR